jgi:hypothetical protein
MNALESLDKFIREHPAISWILWVLGFLVLSRPISLLAAAPTETRFGWMAWAVVIFLLVTPILAFTLERGTRDQELPTLAIHWILAQSPIFASFAAVVIDGSPQYLIAAAQAEAIVLMIFAFRRSKRVGESVA